MNKALKIFILTALRNGLLSKNETMALIRARGIIKLDLSSNGNQDPVCDILQKMLSMEMHFKNIISLGNGKRP